GKHGQYVARIDGLEEVQVGAVFQELWTNGRKWTEQKAFLSLYIPPVQMRHSHRWRVRRLFPVYFCAVHTYHFRVVAYQERTADRESAELPALRDAGRLQQRDRVAAGPHEYIICGIVVNFPFPDVEILDFPPAVFQVFEVKNLVLVIAFCIIMLADILCQFARKLTEMDI